MTRISRRSAWPLYLQIADDLRTQILQQQLSPGDRLPSEHTLMATYDASRQTVRRAIAVLKSEGLLDAAQGQGVFVRATAPLVRRLGPRPWDGSSAGGGFAFGLEGAQKFQIEKEAGQVPAPAAVASRLGLREGSPVHVWRWRIFVDGQPFEVATSYTPCSFLDGEVAQPDSPEAVYDRLDELGQRVKHLTEHVITRMPQPEEARSLDLGPGTPIVLLVRTAYGDNGRPIETCEAMLSADHHELLYEIPAGASTQLVMSGDQLAAALVDVVREAQECFVAVGSRSREPGYLQEIERALQSQPDLVHYRVLIGPPHCQLLKDHLLRLLELRDPQARHNGRKTLHISIADDLTHDYERFFVASERAAVIMLPSATSPANFDTGLVVRDLQYVQGLVQHAKALYGKRRLETAEAVNELSVLR